ncbi:shikimate/quinate 5-dehydrogenase [Rhodoplanes sp. Z2-YC6860]|nr:shikimate/quinate 5-dehydrogenase [Rhodoplanes sp. Z2-YC6860]
MSTRAACVIGWPIRHSRSPLIHGYWIRQHGLDADYRREAVEPAAFADFVRNLSAHGYTGANVTIPHKEMALELSEPDDRARAVGAANTLWLDGGRLRSTNTDVEGFTANLDDAVPGWAQRSGDALVLGAGGSARAVVYGLIERGVARINVVNRTIDRANELARRFGPAVQPADWSALPGLLSNTSLLVNTTSLGMTGQPPLEIDLGPLPAHAIVTDLVYAPLKTSLLGAAEARGLATADGLGMLLHQAVRGFELWFGVRPQVTSELRKLVETDLTK